MTGTAIHFDDDAGFDLGQDLPPETHDAESPTWWVHHIVGNPSHEGRAAAICHELVYGDPETARRWATELRDAAIDAPALEVVS